MPILLVTGLSEIQPDALREFRGVIKRAVAGFNQGVLEIEARQVDVHFLTEVAPDPDAAISLISEGLFRTPERKRERTAAVRQGLAVMLAPMVRAFADAHGLSDPLVEILVKGFDNEKNGFASAPGKKPDR